MKNMLKKMLATLAALAVMVSVVMPCGEGDGGLQDPTYELWDDYNTTVRK